MFMPNEIFDHLQADQRLSETPSHLAFAYAYYFFICYLYRYCKYGKDSDGEYRWTQGKIKEFLGYSAANKKVDYIIKKGGVLDRIGYTKTVTDWPISWSLEFDHDFIEFEMYSELKKEFARMPGRIEQFLGLDRNFRVKYPVKAFNRGKEVNWRTCVSRGA